MIVYGFLLFVIPLYWSGSLLDPNSSPFGLLIDILFYALSGIFGLYYRLEEKGISNKEVSLIAVYSAFTAVARIPFLPIPSLQPCTFLIFIAGYVFGPMVGFIIGANTALLSNFLAGQGPWTVFQMIAWGIVGIIGGGIGLIRRKRIEKLRVPPYDSNAVDIVDFKEYVKLDKRFKVFLSVIGFILGILYGWIMNIWSWLVWIPEHTWTSWLLYYSTSLPYDLIHGIGNMVFIYFFGERTISILERYRSRFYFVVVDKENSEKKEK